MMRAVAIAGALVLAGAAAVSFGGAAAPARTGPPEGYQWEPSFAEEFDRGLDRRRWITAYYDPKTETPTAAKRSLWGNGELQLYFDRDYLGLGIDPFRVADGVLTIAARPLPPAALAKVRAAIAREPAGIRESALNNVRYSSGVISTRGGFTQRHGYWEVRARWSGGKGLWPAVWLLPASGRWPPEIDIVESHGDKPTTAYQSVHTGQHPSITRTSSVSGSTAEFHLYGVHWTPTTLDYYIDGMKTASIPAPNDLTEPMHVLVNLAVGGSWPGVPDAATRFPATLEVDHVRVWRTRGAAGKR